MENARVANTARPGGESTDRAALKPGTASGPPRPVGEAPAGTIPDPDEIVKAAIRVVGVLHGCRLTEVAARIIIEDARDAFPWVAEGTLATILLDRHRRGLLIDNVLTCELAQLLALAATEERWTGGAL